MKIKWRAANLVAASVAMLGVGHAAQPPTRAQPRADHGKPFAGGVQGYVRDELKRWERIKREDNIKFGMVVE